jgi:hypothetical protein
VRLHMIFPGTRIHDLRDLLLSTPHSFLFAATEHLLAASTTPTAPKPITLSSYFFPRHSHSLKELPSSALPTLTPDDLFRSPDYTTALATHLKKLYPLVPLSSIQSLVAEGGAYSHIREGVANWRSQQSRIKILFNDLFGSTSSSSSTKSSSGSTTHTEYSRELLAEIWRFEGATRVKREEDDEQIARELNTSWTDEEQLFTCGCCFDDVAFEDVSVCSSGEHVFCAKCVARQVEEHVYGGAPLMMLEGKGAGVRCLSTEGCQSAYSLVELERVLTRPLFVALETRLGETELERFAQGGGGSNVKLVRCPSCPYTEQMEDDHGFDRALPLWTSATAQDDLSSLAWSTVVTLLSLVILTLLHLLTTLTIFLTPSPFSPFCHPSTSTLPTSSRPPLLFPLLEPYRVLLIAHRYLLDSARKITSHHTGSLNLFRCRNTPTGLPLPDFGCDVEIATSHEDLVRRVWVDAERYCGKVSCVICQRVVVPGLHKCFEDEKEGLRLAVEKAMSEAVKRICSRCGVSFTKDMGCNKVSYVPSLLGRVCAWTS